LAYTQSPSLTKTEVESFLKEAKFARFCSLNKDGTIHVVPVWFKYEDGQIIVVTPPASRKARNVKRNRSVTVLIDVEKWPQKGVIVYGKADLEYPINLEEHMSAMVPFHEKYMSRDKAISWCEGLFKISGPFMKIVVKPTRMASFDYSKDVSFGPIAEADRTRK
jgi:nitroimidazol reductase NimA-like FMN-containing flavoprotein (pyridoxamine 5'-phosphate oxidase superfamily)